MKRAYRLFGFPSLPCFVNLFLHRRRAMAIYALGRPTPELPDDGEFWVAPNASLIGLVRLRRHASVWFGAVLRGDNDWIEVGENSNVQDNSVIHTDPGQPVTIGANVTIGHNVILHSATVGDNTLIGMGSTVLNGARIGPHCIVGANALITENKVIPANSLVLGQPARVVRELDEAQRALISKSAEIYVKNYQRFRAELALLDRSPGDHRGNDFTTKSTK
jgi:carbonic anhydrase/acetyltransferase-like protein (isoleucine patch superfamily)